MTTSDPVVHLHPRLHEEVKSYCRERGLRMKDWVASAIRREMAIGDRGVVSPRSIEICPACRASRLIGPNRK